MDPHLLRYYTQELQHLREMGGEFAQQFPKIAARLGMDGIEVTDPYVERLLEGVGFLAARVQLKLDAEFPRFTQRLLEIVYPNYLAPTPAMLVAQFKPDLNETNLAHGVTLPRGSAMRSLLGKGDLTACEFRTAHDVKLWPLELISAEYFSFAPDLPLATLSVGRKVKGGVRLRVKATAGLTFNQISLDSLRVFLSGADEVAHKLYELCLGAPLGMLVGPTARPAPWLEFVPAKKIEPVGFRDDQALLPVTLRSFQGYRLVQEYFSFPQRYLFVDLGGLAPGVGRHSGQELEIILLFSRGEPALESVVNATNFSLFCAPAINLFPKRADRVHLSESNYEYHVVADRTRPMDFEIYEVTSVTGYGVGAESEQVFLPFYAAYHTEDPEHQAYFTVQREPRLLSSSQKRTGFRSSYVGAEVFIALVDPNEAPYRSDLRQLAITSLCTNRDLPLQMPLGAGKTDFTLEAAAPVEAIRCLKGPSKPFSPMRDGSAWRAISHLSLNYLSLLDSSERDGAAALREMLELYASITDAGMKKQIEGVRSIRVHPTVRRFPVAGPIAFGRGLEITLDVDELAFQGGSVFLFGEVLEQFFARYVSINSFIETVLRSGARGEIMRLGAAMRGTADILSFYRALEERPWGHDFYHTLRRTECLHPGRPRLGRALRPADEPVRFGQEPSTSFAPAALSAFVPSTEGRPPRLEVRFFGLLGPNGPLPLHFTEYARERLLHAGDATFARFLDVFHHRFLALFYRAWAQAQPTISLDRPDDDRFAIYVGALIGLGTARLQKRDAAGDHAKLFYSGLLARHVRNRDGLEALLAGYFRIPVRVEQFVGHWMRLREEDRTRLGNADQGANLGGGAVLGARVWDRQHKFRVHLGPLSLEQYESFLPGGSAIKKLVAWVRQYLCFELEWDTRLVLSKSEVPRLSLGQYGRLGWTTWLGNRRRASDADDLVLDAESILAGAVLHCVD